MFISCDVGLAVRSGHVESILLTNSNKTKFRAASMRSSPMTSFDESSSSSDGMADDDHDVDFQRRTLVYTDGLPGALRCVAVALASRPRLEVFLGRRNMTAELRLKQMVTTEGRPGMKLMRYSVELGRHNFRPSVDDVGRRLTCTAYLHGKDEAANSTSARLIVRRKFQRAKICQGTPNCHCVFNDHLVVMQARHIFC